MQAARDLVGVGLIATTDRVELRHALHRELRGRVHARLPHDEGDDGDAEEQRVEQHLQELAVCLDESGQSVTRSDGYQIVPITIKLIQTIRT